jgi:hypothetical protein
MMQTLSTTAQVIAAAVGMVVFVAILYGGYWVGKYAAYQLFYQEQVRATVRDMVRADALKESL